MNCVKLINYEVQLIKLYTFLLYHNLQVYVQQDEMLNYKETCSLVLTCQRHIKQETKQNQKEMTHYHIFRPLFLEIRVVTMSVVSLV